MGNLANLCLTAGQMDEARVLYEQTLAGLREVGDRRTEAINLSNLAELNHRIGHLQEARRLYAQALELHREVGNRRFEANTLRNSATPERRAGDLDAAERLLDQAEAVLHELGDRYSLAFSLCDRGHLALARGLAARPFLERAQALAQSLDLGPGSELEESVARLRLAIEAFEAGEPLVHGERAQDLPESLRQAFGLMA